MTRHYKHEKHDKYKRSGWIVGAGFLLFWWLVILTVLITLNITGAFQSDSASSSTSMSTNELTIGSNVDNEYTLPLTKYIVPDSRVSNQTADTTGAGIIMDPNGSGVSSWGALSTAVNNDTDIRVNTILTPEGNLDAGNKRLLNLATPVEISDACTKAYVDGSVTAGYTYRLVTNTETLLVSDTFVGVDTSSGSITVTLPPISDFVTGYHLFQIIDVAGFADPNNIIVASGVGDTIQGTTTVVMNVARESVSIFSNGSSEWFIY